MNILVIGNGFDLAHGLPTKYGDFLEFVKVIRQVIETGCDNTLEKVNWGNINNQIKDLIIKDTMYPNKYIFFQEKMCNELLDNNFWIDYFLQCNKNQKENWIDFECEIGNVIKSVDMGMKNRNDNLNSNVSGLENSFLSEYFLNDQHDLLGEAVYGKKIVNKKEFITYKQLIERLENDLDRLILALNKYLIKYVQEIDIDVVSPDLSGIYPDKVLSFNYTNTYQKIYDEENWCKYDYVHGKVCKDINVHLNNMVLGIDEYLEDDRKDKELDFIAFKKYYQRIYKRTGCTYREWVDEILINKSILNRSSKVFSENGKKKVEYKQGRHHNLFVFGHSLDVTDKDILRDLILNDNVHTTIYYNKNGGDDNGRKSLREKVANLVKVIGQDELIRRTGGSTKTIEFKLQQNMVERE